MKIVWHVRDDNMAFAVIPAWMLGDFDKYFNQMDKGEISQKEFYEKIKDLTDVPESVKSAWHLKLTIDGVL